MKNVQALGTLRDEGLRNGLGEVAGEMQGPDGEAPGCQAKTDRLNTVVPRGHWCWMEETGQVGERDR